jgi:hypothetical protein
VQYTTNFASSQAQNGAISKSGISGDDNRLKRGVAGGVGSTHVCEAELHFSIVVTIGLGNAEVITTALDVLDSLAISSRDTSCSSLEEVFGEGKLRGLLDGRCFEGVTPLTFNTDGYEELSIFVASAPGTAFERRLRSTTYRLRPSSYTVWWCFILELNGFEILAVCWADDGAFCNTGMATRWATTSTELQSVKSVTEVLTKEEELEQ